MGVDPFLTAQKTDSLTHLPHCQGGELFAVVQSSTRVPRGAVLALFLFTLYMSDFKYNTELCHLQKYKDDTATVVCIRNGQEQAYSDLVEAFRDWC